MATVSIPLNSDKYPGLFALVDEEDAERVLAHRWRPVYTRGLIYARSEEDIFLHRFVMNAAKGVEIDHRAIDGTHNGLDCRRANLRECTHTQNLANTGAHRNNTSGYKGVHWIERDGKWQARIRADGKRYSLGYFDTAEEAAYVYDLAAFEQHGDYARLNFPSGH